MPYNLKLARHWAYQMSGIQYKRCVFPYYVLYQQPSLFDLTLCKTLKRGVFIPSMLHINGSEVNEAGQALY